MPRSDRLVPESHKDLRRKLEALRRGVPGKSTALPPPSSPCPEPIVYRRDVPIISPRKASSLPNFSVRIETHEPGVEVTSSTGEKSFLISRPAQDIQECPQALSKTFAFSLGQEDSNLRRRLRESLGLEPLAPGEVLFLDLETTGLASTPVFLIGAMVWIHDHLEIQQYFARDYSEERSILSLFLDVTKGKKLLVTFNGKSFDFPYVAARAAANGLTFQMSMEHVDLLHVCRRLWKGKLPDCKLQTLEKHLCKRSRTGDIAGADIPRAYHDYVRTGDAWQMVECLKHNRLDLITLAELLLRLPKT